MAELFYMLPAQASQYQGYGFPVYAILLGYLALVVTTCCVHRPYLTNSSIGQFCVSVSFALWGAFRVKPKTMLISATHAFTILSSAVLIATWLTPLTNLVGHIVSRRPGKKMLWADAWRVVAVMTYKQAIGNWAISQLIGNSVGALTKPGGVNNSITTVASGASPHPAFTRLINFRPKTSYEQGGILGAHRNLLCGDVPWAATNSARALLCPQL